VVDVVACTVQPAEFLQSALRGFQTQRQTTARLRHGRAADAAADGGDDDDDDETAELLQCNLRAHDYRSQQLSRCDQTPPAVHWALCPVHTTRQTRQDGPVCVVSDVRVN